MDIKKLLNFNEPLVSGATLIGFSIILATVVGSYSLYRTKVLGDTIEITGSAKESVTSDYSRWTISLDTKTGITNQQSGLDRLDKARAKVISYLESVGMSDIESPSAYVSADYSYPEGMAPIHTGYTVSRQIYVRSADVMRITELANNLEPLSGFGYNVTTQGVELTYQKLPEMRVRLLSGAIADARARAEAIARETDRSVSALKSATGGVVQVLPRGGVEISDYGSYDTQNMEKDVMVTVRAVFRLR